MTLASGTRLGPYEILLPLGAGGMGEVYLAKDTKLGRDVAVKILPEALASDTDALARFVREAKSVAALSHPNILSIFDFGSEARTTYAVTELLEGETLRDRLREGRLPPRKAVEIAVQIARGLAAAHEKGIIHRDLKPENLFVTADGRAKILDFGLARQAPLASGDDTKSPTVEKATDPGTVLGTVGYMSPEQVRGRSADHRSDIFSFGCVLYEMLSGERAFKSDSAVETMNAILKEEPRVLSEETARIPPELERIVHHCLEKSPGERFQSIGDVAFDLETAVSGSSPAVTARAGSGPRLLRALAFAASFAAVAGAGVWLGARISRSKPPTFSQITFRRGRVFSARFTPDGSTVVYGAAWGEDPIRISSVRTGSPASSPLDLPGGTVLSVSRSGELAIARDYRWIGGFRFAGILARAALGGGGARDVLEYVSEADWNPAGTDLAVAREVGGRFRLEYPVGTVLHETGGYLSGLRFSPRGDLIAFFDHPSLGNDDGDVMVVEPGKPARKLSRDWKAAHGLAWSPDGREVWFTATRENGSASALQAVALSGAERTVFRGPGRLILDDVSRGGSALLTVVEWTMGISALAPGETRERDLSWLDWSLVRDISADGRSILFDESGEGAGEKTGVFIRRTDGGPAVRLGDGEARSLSPDGGWALVMTESTPAQLRLLPTGTGQPRDVTNDRIDHRAAQFFRDGKRILFVGSEGGGPNGLYVQSVDGGPPRRLGVETAGVVRNFISPDDDRFVVQLPSREWVIYRLSDGSKTPIRGMEEPEVVLGWAPDGRNVLVMRRDLMPPRVFTIDVASGQRRLFRELAPRDPSGIGAIPGFLTTADGHSYVYSYNRRLDALYVAQGLK